MAESLITRRRVLLGAGVGGAAALLPLTATVARADGDSTDSIAGAWRGAGTLTQGPSFQFLAAFSQERTIVASASIDLQDAFLSTPSYGAWKRLDGETYRIKLEFFTGDASHGGAPSGSGTVTGTVTVDGDTLHGPITLTVFDTSGTTLFSAKGGLRLSRIHA